ncbi:capsule biosynthesis GfcC family protein [Alteromonas lipolytica]|uniref:Uncharacterized protein n=1 Tax=Alteromonas lipolytica TaxID=1856405 RepID=A0A1E8FHI3_9ALTE|nr:capsule biosynthesis GfcC family protein [Alteromonas lipolytica]OFI35402.1 hypothetical protein BFC17_11560 [Alteromonas lipolytica]GGF76015.1 hypothetical protein GCM10011338_30140 [Alteromonas lipolytica]
MKYFIRTALVALLCLPSWVLADVTFNVAGKIITFNQPVRLATVLSMVEPTPEYWANAAVYHLEDPDVEQMRAEVLKQLASLIRQQTKDSNAYRNLTAFYQEIGRWQLMRRLNINIDYDQARLNPKRNPQFNEGVYYIRLKPRTEQIKLTGMLTQATALPFDGSFTVTDYLDKVQLSHAAHRDYVYLLEPDGAVNKLGIAYWNKQHYRPMPGSEIFIPLQDELFFDRIGSLNDHIAQLMMHRM